MNRFLITTSVVISIAVSFVDSAAHSFALYPTGENISAIEKRGSFTHQALACSLAAGFRRGRVGYSSDKNFFSNLPQTTRQGYLRVANQMAEIARKPLSSGGVIVLEGYAGSGKTTLASLLPNHLPRSFVLSLDKFMKAKIYQEAFRRKIVDGNLMISDAHRSVVRWQYMEDFLEKLLEKLSSPVQGRETFELKEVFPAGRSEKFSIGSGDTVILEGGWPFYIKALRATTCATVVFRVITDPVQATLRFAGREKGRLSQDNQARYYALAIAPTRAVYEKFAESWINFIVDLKGTPEHWRVIPYAEYVQQAA